METKKIFVTGATGRLGNVVCRKLVEQGHQVTALQGPTPDPVRSLEGVDVQIAKGDINDAEVIDFEVSRSDIVIHLAALIALRKDKDGIIWRTNAEGSKLIAECSLKHNVEKFVFCGSHHALEREPYNEPMDESRPLSLNDFCSYHKSKAWGEKYVLDLVDEGLKAVVISPGTIIGPYAFYPGILDNALIDLYKGKIPSLIDGDTDYADVRDIADGCIAAMHKGRIGERYFLTGDMLSMRDMAKAFAGNYRKEDA